MKQQTGAQPGGAALFASDFLDSLGNKSNNGV